jgi:hypothetical protein
MDIFDVVSTPEIRRSWSDIYHVLKEALIEPRVLDLFDVLICEHQEQSELLVILGVGSIEQKFDEKLYLMITGEMFVREYPKLHDYLCAEFPEGQVARKDKLIIDPTPIFRKRARLKKLFLNAWRDYTTSPTRKTSP